MNGPRRPPVFMHSDVRTAAEEFVEAIAEHADPVWHEEDKVELVESLTERATAVLTNPDATWARGG